MEFRMKYIIFILLLFSNLVMSQEEENLKYVKLDSLTSKAFRFQFLECDLIQKELNSTEKLLLKEEKTTSALEKIISMQETEQMAMLEIIDRERKLKEKAEKENDNLNKILNKRKNKNVLENIGIGIGGILTGIGIGSLLK